MSAIPAYAVVLAALASVLVIITTVRGPGLSPDSVTYLSTGIHLANSEGLTNLTGVTLTVFPPAVPAIAALGESLGVSAQQTIRWFTAACAAAIVVLGHLLLRRVALRRGVLVGATVLLGVSPILHDVSKMAWSESAFIVLSLVFLLLLGRIWSQRQLSNEEMVALAVLCWAGFLFRYAGVSLVAAGGLILLVALWPLNMRRFFQVAAFGLLAALVPLVWMLRNHAVDGTWLGPRVPSSDSPADIAVRIVATAGRWLLPVAKLKNPVVAAVGLCALALVAVLLVVMLRAARHDAEKMHRLLAGLGPPTLFTVVYVGYLAIAQLTTAIDPIDSRLLSPVYVPAVLLVAVAVNVVLDRLADSTRQIRVGAVVAAFGIVFLLGQFTLTARAARAGVIGGIGFNSRSWQDSELAAATAADAQDAILYSNSAEGLWAATGLQPLFPVPRSAGVRGSAVEGQLEAFAQEVACSERPVLLAMYSNGDSRSFSIDEMAEVVVLEVEVETSDGVLYRVSPLDPAQQTRC